MGPIEKPWSDLSSVESPDNPSRDHQREKRESSSMELPGKLCEVNTLDKGLQKKCRSRKIESIIPDNDTKMLSHNFTFPNTKASGCRIVVTWNDLSLSP
jgi:hypothetical protein